MEIYSADDVSKQKRQKVYKSFGFAKMVLISKVGETTKDSEDEIFASILSTNCIVHF